MAKQRSSYSRRSVLKKGAIATGALVIGGTAATGTAAAGIGDGRVGHYPLNNLKWDKEDREKNVVHDASTYDNHGVNHGATVVKDGAVGNAYEFSSGNFVRIPDADSLDGMSGLTISTWVNFNDVTSGAQSLVRKTGSYLLQKHSNNFISFAVWDGSLTDWAKVQTRTFDTDDNGTWFHVAGVFDGERYAIYLDGTEEDTYGTSAESADGSSNDVGVGVNDPDNIQLPFAGRLDEVRIYDRALSDDEIQELADMDED